jgi:dolichyl-phosphate beta-glucosyltransferase
VDAPLALSIVVPGYNEERRLEPGLTNALAFFRQNLQTPFEIVLVDDGSTDRTRELYESAKARFSDIPISILGYRPNRGKGRAVKTGILAARGEKILVMDSDFSIEIGEMFKFLEALDSYDAAVGTKKHALTETLRPQGPARRFLGKGATGLANLVLGIRYTDITCGLKGFRGSVARDVFSRQIIERWSYDCETLFLLERRGYTSVEIPVRWRHEKASKVRLIGAIASSLWELFAIRWNWAAGRYK